MGEGVGPGTALGVALQTAELTQALATVVANAFGDAGHALTSANQELLERLAVGVLRDALAKEFDSVR
jgi:cell pole-organizing protein PopZ